MIFRFICTRSGRACMHQGVLLAALRRKVNRGEHESVPAELMKWVWAAGKKLPGLIHRRGREGTAYFSNYESGKNNKSSDYQIN